MQQQWDVNEKKKKRIEGHLNWTYCYRKEGGNKSLWNAARINRVFMNNGAKELGMSRQRVWTNLRVKRAKWRNRQWARAPFTPDSITWLIMCNTAWRVFLPGPGGEKRLLGTSQVIVASANARLWCSFSVIPSWAHLIRLFWKCIYALSSVVKRRRQVINKKSVVSAMKVTFKELWRNKREVRRERNKIP